MFAFTYSAAILAIINLGFAAFLIFKKWKIKLARYLVALFLTSTICLAGNVFADISYTENLFIFWAGTSLIGAIFAMAVYANLIEVFTGHPITKLKIALIYIPGIILSLFAYSKYSITEINFPYNMAAESTAGSLYCYVLVYTVLLWIFSLIRVIQMHQKATITQKAQISYIFVGFGIASLCTMFCNAILPLFGNTAYFTLGPQSIVFLSITLTYSILKHGLLNIKIIIQKSLIYSLLIITVIGLYLIFISLITSLITFTGIKYHFIASLFAALFGAIGVPPLKKYLKRKTDKIFFKDRVPYTDAVHALSSAMNLSLDLHDLLKRTAETLCVIFKPNEIKIFLNREKILLHKKNSHNSRITIINDADFEILPADDDSMLVNAEYDSITLAQVFIGEKLSGDIYLPEDRQILQTFSGQFAMALQKTFYFEKMKKHAKKLEKILSDKK